jgi:uncharacterized protein YbjT (DUF2867 family)
MQYPPVSRSTQPQSVLLTGATGYVGGQLLPLLEAGGHRVRCLTRRPHVLESRGAQTTTVVQGDLREPSDVATAVRGVDTVYYLAHALGTARGFAEEEARAASVFTDAARAAGVSRVIYLGGLGSEAVLSPHLASRQRVGEILRRSGVPTIEFRASIIIGSGSLSFEMIRALVERLPVMVAPRWVAQLAQPIGIDDVLAYLLAALDAPQDVDGVVEIGGPDRVSYGWLLREYARQRRLRRVVVPVPVLTPRLSSLWLGLVTPVHARVGRKLVDSLRHDTVVTDNRASKLFPVRPRGAADAIARVLAEEDRAAAHGCYDYRLTDSRSIRVDVSAHDAFRPIERIGGSVGWYWGNWLWRLRGLVDVLVGGTGLRRSRPDGGGLMPGDTVDWWRVEALEPNRRLRLRAEMRLPGRAWLQFDVTPRAGGGSVIRQTAIFDPRGVFGRLYWYALVPIHHYVFAGMLRGIGRAAARGGPRMAQGERPPNTQPT